MTMDLQFLALFWCLNVNTLLPLQVLLPCWTTNTTAAVVELYWQPYSPANSSGKAISGSSSNGAQPAICFARLELPLPTVASQQTGKTTLLKDLQLTVVAGAAAMAAKGKAAAVTASIEVVVWEVAAYLENLRQLAAATQAAAKEAAGRAAASAVQGEIH